MAFLDDYESVADRIDRFWTEHPVGTITTELVYHDDKRFIVKASIWRRAHDVARLGNAASGSILLESLQPHATGYAEEIIGATPVNKTSALENCETSAIGRALANLGFAAKGQRPSREEMVKAQPAPRPRSGGRVSPSKPQSPESHETAPPTNGNGEPVPKSTNAKQRLLDAVNGDKAKAAMIWRETLGQFGFQPDDPIPVDMWPPIGEALKARVSA